MEYENLSFPRDSLFLVTGGAGFIGSNLCEAILGLGYRVCCLDNLSNGHKHNIEALKGNPDFTFVEGDICDFDTCMRVSENADYILHQAAWGSVPRSIEYPLMYVKKNIVGTANMLEAARENGVKRFVYASSSSVYGDERTLPRIEERVGNLLSPYAVSKRNNEELAKQYFLYHGLETYGLRYFNVFGRRQDPNGTYAAVIPKFISRLLAGKRPTIYGDGEQSRDFTYIDNVIEANLKACLAPSEFAGEVFNIGTGGQSTLLEVYDTICELLNTNVEPIFTKERPGDIKHSNSDISKAREKLNYNPKWSFDEGIRAAIEWYKDNL